jgi:hypothetical protein
VTGDDDSSGEYRSPYTRNDQSSSLVTAFLCSPCGEQWQRGRVPVSDGCAAGHIEPAETPDPGVRRAQLCVGLILRCLKIGGILPALG